MKLLILALTIITKMSASPVSPEQTIARAQPALQYTLYQDEFGQYDFEYLTGEGTIHKEHGKLIPSPDGRSKVLAVKGEVIYIGDDNKVYTTKYNAGAGGTIMEESHLPVAPEYLLTAESTRQRSEDIDSVDNASKENFLSYDAQSPSEGLHVDQVFKHNRPDPSKAVIQMILPKEFIDRVTSKQLKKESESLDSGPPLSGPGSNVVSMSRAVLPVSGTPIMDSPEGQVHISQIRIPEELMSEVVVPDSPRLLSGIWQNIDML